MTTRHDPHQSHWYDADNDTIHGTCVCGHDCSTHNDAANPLDGCADCGADTCPDCREYINNAPICVDCLHTRALRDRADEPPTTRRLVSIAEAEGFPAIETTHADGRLSYTAPYRCPDCRTPHVSQDEAIQCCGGQEMLDQRAYEVMAEQLAEMLRRI